VSAAVRWLPVVAVVALQVPYPLVHGHARDVVTVATVVVFAVASLGYAATSRGWRYALVLVLAAGVGGFGAEVLGVHTGVPFGSYVYTGGLGPSVWDVPLVVGGAWLMMAHPSVVVAARVTRNTAGRVVLAAVALAGWDVFLDPQMVAARHWRWSDVSPHVPGISDVPLSNLGGWLLVALVMAAVLVPVAGAPAAYVDQPAVVLWLWVWLSSALAAAAFFGELAVAGWGLLAMGLVGLPLLVREIRG
jgi:uncharacterized membrane protein